MNLIFFGSSDFSIPVLDQLTHSKHSVLQVVTTPDRKKGRGQKVAPSVVRVFAEKKSISVLAPEKLRAPEVLKQITDHEFDFLVVASYGKMIPTAVFEAPRIAALNVHPSLLPKYRGASPIQAAILAGDGETGVSVSEVTKDLDAGDIFGQMRTKIDAHENASELSDRLAGLAAELVLDVLKDFEGNQMKRIPQVEEKSSYAKKIEKDFGRMNWDESAESIHNRVRACYPWPSVYASWKGKRLKLLKTGWIQEVANGGTPGTVLELNSESGIHVQAGSGVIILKRVQLEGRRDMGAYDFAMGQRLEIGNQFGSL